MLPETSRKPRKTPPPAVFIGMPWRQGNAAASVLGRLLRKRETVPLPMSVGEWLEASGVADIDGDAALDGKLGQQLGTRWAGFDGVSLTAKAILLRAAYFCVVGKTSEEYDAMVVNLRSASDADAAEVIQEFVDTLAGRSDLIDWIERVAAKHAFEVTAAIRACAIARSKGLVLVSETYNWLGFVDRTMWLTMASLGLRDVFPEGSVAFAHYRAEVEANHAIAEPNVGSLVASLKSGRVRQCKLLTA
ncbi:hypothetical protein HFN89_05520 [Rhizobium laguerreae]|nr:hypothetical protein [Rhizobium laguerreae]